jgi:1-acyl-sn-glycerol-3-phosphate acyltransferase
VDPAADRTYEPFDPQYTRAVIERVFDAASRHWFRPRLIGAEHLPETGPLILAGNHSGTAFPYDAIVLDATLWHHDDYCPERKLRPLFEKELTQAWWMRPFGLDNFWRRCGGIDTTFDNFDRLLAGGERVMYYPEGVPGIGKGFQNRYRLQRFSTSFVIMAARHRAPVVPVSIVNAEWVMPFNFTIPALDRFMQHRFHVPFLPLPGAPIAITFPWAWYLSLPARMVFVLGEAIDVRAMVDAEGVTDLENPDRAAMRRVADRVRDHMQKELDRNVARYGRWPYQARSLVRGLLDAIRRRELIRSTPLGWAWAFTRFHRDLERAPARNLVHAILRDWDLVGYYLPLGWPLLSLARNLRRPPCGYRGLDPETRRAREGNFVWTLADRPLPSVRPWERAGGLTSGRATPPDAPASGSGPV